MANDCRKTGNNKPSETPHVFRVSGSLVGVLGVNRTNKPAETEINDMLKHLFYRFRQIDLLSNSCIATFIRPNKRIHCD